MIDPKVLCLLLSAVIFGPLQAALARSSTEDAETFEKQIRPLLVENCSKCHGSEKQKGGLRLDSRKSLVEGGESGPAVVPGHPNKSLLISAVRQKGELRMPPGRKLRGEQIAALERWVAEGAHWPTSLGLPAGRSASPAAGPSPGLVP
jgi:mono/diheme cytochrome c family protein